MPIRFDAEQKLFQLDAGNTTYAFAITDNGEPTHLYFGPKLSHCAVDQMYRPVLKAFSPTQNGKSSRDTSSSEYACFGSGDFRTPSTLLRQSDGHAVLNLHYSSHRIVKGKKALNGLPCTFGKNTEVDTLSLVLTDEKAAVEYVLNYSAFRDLDVICRSVCIRNIGTEPFRVEKAASSLLEIAGEGRNFDVISLPGSWSRERRFTRTPVVPGLQVLSSSRGLSSHQMNPSFALASRTASEEFGRVYGMLLLYSGNFASEIELDQFGSIRLQTGINPLNFAWNLAPGEEFQTPEAAMTATDGGFGAMSRTFHDLIRDHIIRSRWVKKERPILVNNWEATYFDFDEKKLLAIAKGASELGIQMLVLDDGWFGKRENDHSGLGDWMVNRKKLKGGLEKLGKELKQLGMKFGLWFEPEMISEDSDLFRKHPDWYLHIDGRKQLTGRNQHVLDMGRDEVVAELFRMICAILDTANIDYIKWDANRHITEAGSAVLPPEKQQEVCHRFVLGTYRLHEMLIERYPNLLIEGCSGGGGRFDAGMFYYVPQIWCSDDTDAYERLRIQYGTSMFYPCSSMGAHVSVCPNHQTGRSTPFETRGVVAMAGTFGYELDLNKLSDADKAMVGKQTKRYHQVNPLVAKGDLYRLGSAETDELVAWSNVAKDRRSFVVSWVYPVNSPHQLDSRIRLRGLNADTTYVEAESGRKYRGDFLMNFGLLFEENPRFDGVSGQLLFFAED